MGQLWRYVIFLLQSKTGHHLHDGFAGLGAVGNIEYDVSSPSISNIEGDARCPGASTAFLILVVVGGASDRFARSRDYNWVLNLRQQCIRQNVSFQSSNAAPAHGM